MKVRKVVFSHWISIILHCDSNIFEQVNLRHIKLDNYDTSHQYIEKFNKVEFIITERLTKGLLIMQIYWNRLKYRKLHEIIVIPVFICNN